MNILVIDAQGGGIGRQLVTAIKAAMPDACITAVGTNSAATAAMVKAKADKAATGENAVVVGCRHADVIVGRDCDRGFTARRNHTEDGFGGSAE